jgi:hypothetical protein
MHMIRLLGLSGVVMCALIALAYQAFVATPREEASQAAYVAAKQAVTPQTLTLLFQQWRRTTYENGAAVDWVGATSKVLWIEYRPAWRMAFGEGGPEERVVWARSPGGRYYRVTFGITQGDLKVWDGPRETSETDLVAALVEKGQTTLIDELKLPRKPA